MMENHWYHRVFVEKCYWNHLMMMMIVFVAMRAAPFVAAPDTLHTIYLSASGRLGARRPGADHLAAGRLGPDSGAAGRGYVHRPAVGPACYDRLGSVVRPGLDY